MKHINLSSANLDAILRGEAKRKFDLKVAWHQLKKNITRYLTAVREATVDFLAGYTPLEKYTFALYCLLALAIVSSFWLIYPTFGALLTVEEKVASVRTEIREAKSDLAALESIGKEITTIKSAVKKMQRAIPTAAREEDIVTTIMRLTSQNHLTPPKRIAWSREKETAVESVELRDHFEIYAYNFATSGSYADVEQILRDIAKNVRLLDVRDVRLVPLANGSIELTLTVWAYNLKQ